MQSAATVRIRIAGFSTPFRQPLAKALAGFDPGTRWQANIAVAYGARQEVARPDKKR